MLLFIKRISFYCSVFLLIAGCGGGGGGSDGGGDNGTESDDISVNISGFVDIPNFESTEGLVVVFEDIDTKDYLYEGQTDIDGLFSGDIVGSNNQDRILIRAIDPNNPDAYAMALVELNEPTSQNQGGSYTLAVQATSNDKTISVNINSQTTAEVIVLDAIGELRDLRLYDLSPNQQVIGNDITSRLDNGEIPVCPGAGTQGLERTLESLISFRDTSRVRERFDNILLSDDLVAAQKEVSSVVRAANLEKNPIKRWLSNWAVLSTRHKLSAVMPILDLEGLPDDDNYVMNHLDLELIADIIMYDGRGNCRENAFVGAYIASRIKSFKQVAVVGLQYDEDGGNGHAVAIGCEEGSEIYDIKDFRNSWLYKSDNRENQDILKAKCTIIDPWRKETLSINHFLDTYGSDDQSTYVFTLIPIKLEDDTNRISTLVNHFSLDACARCQCSFGLPGFCSAQVEVKAIHIRAKNIKVNAVIHYGSEDQHYVGEDTRNFHSEIDEPSSFSNYTFFQSYTSEDGNRTKEMSVTFNPGLTKVIKFDAESDTTVTGDNIPGGSYNLMSEISGTSTFDVDPSNHRLFKIAGAEACDKIDKIKYSQTGEGVSNWEVLGVADDGCDEDAELKIEITTN